MSVTEVNSISLQLLRQWGYEANFRLIIDRVLGGLLCRVDAKSRPLTPWNHIIVYFV